MKQRSIGSTGIGVSPVCLGTMTFGTPVAEAKAVGLVHWALDNGVNFFDTADMYEGYNRFMGSPGGVGETILGKALEGRRDKAVVTTKVGSLVGDDNYKGGGLGQAHVVHQIDLSLRRLRTDYVDFYEMHRPDLDTPLADSIAAFADLIAAGKVRHWGFSNFEAAQIHEIVALCDANGWPRPVLSQQQYSWLEREIEAEHLPACMEYGIAVTPFRLLASGLLTGKYKRGQPAPPGSRADDGGDWLHLPDDAVYDRLETFEEEARHAGLAPAQYAIRWVLDRPGVSSAIVGVKRIEQLRQTLVE